MTTYFQLYHAIRRSAQSKIAPPPLAANRPADGRHASARTLTPQSPLLLNPSLHDQRPRRARPLSEQHRAELLETANDNLPPFSPSFGRMG